MKMKVKHLFMTIFFVVLFLPIVVLAEETENEFNHIDIDKIVSLKYTVLGSEKSAPTVDSNLSGIKIYKLDKDDTSIKTEINFSNEDISQDENVYHINGTFPKYYTDDDTSVSNEVKYLVEYTFSDDEINRTVTYTKEYSFTSENNESTDDGILIKLQDNEIIKEFAPKIIVKKVLQENTPDPDLDKPFKFNIKDTSNDEVTPFTISTVSGNGSYTIKNIKLDTSYIIEEIDLANTYELVSIISDKEDQAVEHGDNAIAVKATDIEDTIIVTITNKSKLDHSKDIIDNGDGTYKISLDVTGENETSIKKANVIIVMDTSHSMVDNTTELVSRFKYTYNSNTYNDNYYYDSENNGNRVYYRNGRWRTSDSNNGAHYNGDVWAAPRESTVTRLVAEQNALYSVIQQLLSNNKPDKPDIIDISVVSFDIHAHDVLVDDNNQVIYYSHDYATIYDGISGVGVDHGTNWEEGLIKGLDYANFLKEQFPTEDVYVIFLTDGEPTARQGSSTYTTPNGGRGHQEDDAYWKHWNGASDEAKEIAENYTLYTIFTYGKELKYINFLDNLTHYAYSDYPDGTYTSEATIGAGDDEHRSSYFFNATDTSELVKALNKIVNDINISGIGSVIVNDGTTQSVTTSSGVSNLLTVDESSFEYWLTFDVTNNNKIKFNDTEVTISENSDGTYRLNWIEGGTEKYVDLEEGSYYSTNDDNETVFVYKWTGKNQLYNAAPPTAELVDGSVNWSLSKDKVGVLLNGVKYSVTFNVWPSQDTYDLISDLDNGILKYDDLDDNIKKYLTSNDGNYSLATNTIAILKYDDSRDNDGERITNFVNPEPVATGVSEISLKKYWENNLDERNSSSIDIYLTKDGIKYGNVDLDGKILPFTLKESEDWSKSLYISTGLISFNEETKTATIREVGHDYSFQESANDSYYWDLVVNTLRPMIINNELTMLIKVDSEEVNVDEFDEKNYLEKNGNKYFKICDKNGNQCAAYKVDTSNNSNFIKATNYRRSNLNITKVVDGDYKEGSTFKFELTVTDKLGNDLWFSIFDSNDNIVESADVSGTGLQKEYRNGNFTGYYYIPSGNKITVIMEPLWNLRFINLPNGSSYVFNEIVTAGFKFISAVSEEDETLENDGTSVSGNINTSNTKYTVVYTNQYIWTDVEVIKEWKEDTLDVRPQSITVRLYADNVEKYSQVITANNDWKYTWSNLDKYNSDGSLIVYTITEDKVDNYYTVINGYKIENTYLYTVVPIEITKEWVNYNSGSNDNIVITVSSSNIEEVEASDITISYDMCTVNGNKWTCELSFLKYYYDEANNELKLIEYMINEKSINGLELDSEGKYYVYDSKFINQLLGIWHSEIDGLNIKNTWEEMPTEDFIFKKIAFNSNNSLINGAVFRLYRYLLNEKSSDNLVNIYSDNSGTWELVAELGDEDMNTYNFTNLYFGEYRLIEIKAPDGYILPDGQWRIMVNPSDTNNPIEVEGIGVVPALISKTENEYLIPNKIIPVLPSTGGFGIPNYNLIGLLIMLFGASLYFINKNNYSEIKY